MSAKQAIDEKEVSEAKRVLLRTLRDFRQFPCESTLSLLIIRLFETVQIICSYWEGSYANYKCVKKYVDSKIPTAFTYMRNSLVHEMAKLEDFAKFLRKNLCDYSQQSFNRVCEICFGKSLDLYSEIMIFLDNFQQQDVGLDSEDIDEDKGSESFEEVDEAVKNPVSKDITKHENPDFSGKTDIDVKNSNSSDKAPLKNMELF